MSELNPIKIASVISDKRERHQVEQLIANYRADIINELTGFVWKMREFEFQADIPVYQALNRILKELNLYR